MIFRRLMHFGFAFLIGILLAFANPQASADISLAKIFSDHMVLQRNSKVKISGMAEPGQKLSVKFADQESKATANAKGEWVAFVLTPPAGGPYELEVVAQEGEPKVVFSDVWSGEVWLCAGHNMERPVSAALNAETEIEHSKDFPAIRLFSIDHSASVLPLDDFTKVEPWRECGPEAVKEFSATAYFFGRELSKELKDVRIGLVDASWEGSVCEAWTSRNAMDSVESLAPLLRYWDESDKPPTDMNRPGNLYNGMISPLIDFPMRGVIWYQGEANHGRGHQYGKLLPTLIGDWRRAFKNNKLPFYIVQLAPYRYEQKSPEGLPELWDAQLRTHKTVPNTALVVTTDIGNLQEVHPKNKQEVGRRLSLVALSEVYQKEIESEKPIVASGPIYEKMSTNENRIRILFKNAKGLRATNKDEKLTCFLICGEDKSFVPATAVINGETIEVSSPEIKNPIAIRFAWDDSAEPNLVNGEGLPASPFRTDDFPLQSVGRDF